MSKDGSKWALLNKYYDAKRLYYGEGRSSLTDQEFDALEKCIGAIHGEDTVGPNGQSGEWSCVGYDEVKHEIIKKNLAIADKKFYIKWGYKMPDRLIEVNENEEYEKLPSQTPKPDAGAS